VERSDLYVLHSGYDHSPEGQRKKSVAFLRGWDRQARGPIHLLYLDSLDYHDYPQSEAHCLAEAEAALPALAPACLILIDDTRPDREEWREGEALPPLWGKGARAVPFLVEQGFVIEQLDGQALLTRPAGRGVRKRRGRREEAVAVSVPSVLPVSESEEGAMGKETRKAFARRQREGYFDRIFVGEGIDIGCGDDPVTPDCLHWDLGQGDAQELAGLEAERLDWVYSSHCLEHLRDPWRAVLRWWEVLKPGGCLLIVVPDEDLYEQGHWPSRFNPDHKWTFTLHKTHSWSPVSINLAELVATLPGHRVEWLRTLDSGYDYTGGVWDRTGGLAEAHIEALVWKTGVAG
jgi:hypothetical protein